MVDGAVFQTNKRELIFFRIDYFCGHGGQMKVNSALLRNQIDKEYTRGTTLIVQQNMLDDDKNRGQRQRLGKGLGDNIIWG
jgi:hypothetical protein